MTRSMRGASAMSIVAGVVGLITTQSWADSGDFSIDWTAAAPGSFNHSVGGGAFDDRTVGDANDIVEQINGGAFACGDIVTYLLKITVDDNPTDAVQTLELEFSFTDSTGQSGAAYLDVVDATLAPNYGTVVDLIEGNHVDTAIMDDGGSTVTKTSEAFDPAGSTPFGSPDADRLLLTFRIDDLEAGEMVVVRIDVTLTCDPGSTPTGNLQGRFLDGRVVAPVLDEFQGNPMMTINLALNDFEVTGACCIDISGTSCQDLTESDCEDANGTFISGATCADSPCGSDTSACCMDDGTCTELSGMECTDQGGVLQPGQTCAEANCPSGACCFDTGECTDEDTESDCTAAGGSWQGAGTMCSVDDCPDGACCLADGTCEIQDTMSACEAAGGAWQGAQTTCDDSDCAGACCLAESVCELSETQGDCETSGGVWLGSQTVCSEFACSMACCLHDATCITTTFDGCSEAAGFLLPLGAQCSTADCSERSHPGWNHVSAEITLSKNEPAYWSAFSGHPKGVPPMTVLDPGFPPGRPDVHGGRVLRGYIVGWAVDPTTNEEIRWNHLKGDAVIINYADPAAWEYNAWAFQCVANVANGEATDSTPGTLNFDGIEYTQGFDQLILDFYASGSNPFGAIVNTDLTLHPVSVDLRQEDDGPVTTKAKVDVWNENEVKFNGTERCITCWDQTLLRDYAAFGVPNNFLYTTLQTNKGKARINGLRSDNCDLDYEFDPDIPFGDDPRDVVSEDASLLGLSAKWIGFVESMTVAGAGDAAQRAAAGSNLVGMGTQSATLRYDALEVTPESVGGEGEAYDIINQLIGSSTRRSPARGHRNTAPAEGVGSSGPDRVSATEKGSVLFWSKVEIRWDLNGDLVQDTFIDISNDWSEDVAVQLYFINGDAPRDAVVAPIRE